MENIDCCLFENFKEIKDKYNNGVRHIDVKVNLGENKKTMDNFLKNVNRGPSLANSEKKDSNASQVLKQARTARSSVADPDFGFRGVGSSATVTSVNQRSQAHSATKRDVPLSDLNPR